MHPLLLALRTGWFAEGRFLGRVLDEWSQDAEEFVRLKLPHLLLVAIIAFLLNRIVQVITHRMIRIAEQHAGSVARVSQVKTLAGVIRTTGIAVITLIAGLQILAALGANLAPLLASAGVAGIAIGLAAQNIVKDMLNGVLILVEDQFNVGDTVRVAGVGGVVEAMTLRRTTVRDDNGTVYVIPNSQISTVANLSAGYSVAQVNVSVDFSADPDEVVKLLKSVAMDLRTSAEYRDLFVADPQILGVDAIKGSELIFPVVFRTVANKQYAPMREFRRRVRLALAQHHLLPGDPFRVFNEFEHPVSRGIEAEKAEHRNDPTALKPPQEGLFGGE